MGYHYLEMFLKSIIPSNIPDAYTQHRNSLINKVIIRQCRRVTTFVLETQPPFLYISLYGPTYDWVTTEGFQCNSWDVNILWSHLKNDDIIGHKVQIIALFWYWICCTLRQFLCRWVRCVTSYDCQLQRKTLSRSWSLQWEMDKNIPDCKIRNIVLLVVVKTTSQKHAPLKSCGLLSIYIFKNCAALWGNIDVTQAQLLNYPLYFLKPFFVLKEKFEYFTSEIWVISAEYAIGTTKKENIV